MPIGLGLRLGEGVVQPPTVRVEVDTRGWDQALGDPSSAAHDLVRTAEGQITQWVAGQRQNLALSENAVHRSSLDIRPLYVSFVSVGGQETVTIRVSPAGGSVPQAPGGGPPPVPLTFVGLAVEFSEGAA